MGQLASSAKRTVSNAVKIDAKAKDLQVEENDEIPQTKTNSVTSKKEDKMNEGRFHQLLLGLQRIARLRRDTARVEIDVRQKHKKESLTRQYVWSSDSRFMGEVQRLVASGLLSQFVELTKLAAECQRARDQLEFIEQESMEAELEWQGANWKLRHAEEELHDEFADGFAMAAAITTASPSVEPSPYRPSTEVQSNASAVEPSQHGSHIAGHHSPSSGSKSAHSHHDYASNGDELFLDVDGFMGLDTDARGSQGFENYNEDYSSWDSEIDMLIEWPRPPRLGKALPLPADQPVASFEGYPELLTEFTSVRQRIDKWLENSTLSSRLESTQLLNAIRSKFEESEVPSNWAQLTIAYWELKGPGNKYIRYGRGMDTEVQYGYGDQESGRRY